LRNPGLWNQSFEGGALAYGDATSPCPGQRKPAAMTAIEPEPSVVRALTHTNAAAPGSAHALVVVNRRFMVWTSVKWQLERLAM
jgi:hypothetical protein